MKLMLSFQSIKCEFSHQLMLFKLISFECQQGATLETCNCIEVHLNLLSVDTQVAKQYPQSETSRRF